MSKKEFSDAGLVGLYLCLSEAIRIYLSFRETGLTSSIVLGLGKLMVGTLGIYLRSWMYLQYEPHLQWPLA